MHDRIKLLRRTLNLSQKEFGEKVGVSRDVISNIEYNRVQPKDLLIKHICDLYNVNEQWMYTGEGPMFNSHKKVTKVDEALSIFNSLCPEFQDYALQQIKQLAELQSKSK